MIEDLVDDGTSVLNGVRPVGGSHLVFFFCELVFVLFLIVVCDLSGAPCRESDLGLRRRLAACSNGMLALALLLGRDVATGSNVAIRLGV